MKYSKIRRDFTISRFWKLGLFVWGVFMLSGIVLTSGLTETPLDKPAGGTLSARLIRVAQSCPAKQFLKGFDANHSIICAPYNASSQGENASTFSIASSSFPSTPTGQWTAWRIGTFLTKMSGSCKGGTVIKGFTSDGTKICVSPLSPQSYSAGTNSQPTGITWPSSKSNSSAPYVAFFINMTSVCSDSDSAVSGIAPSGAPICTKVPIDGWWGSYGSYGSCSALCGGGKMVRNRSCISPSPRNGGANCVGSSWEETSCNTQACAPPAPIVVNSGFWCDATSSFIKIEWSCGGGKPGSGWVDVGGGCYHHDTGISCAGAPSTYAWATDSYGACTSGQKSRRVYCEETASSGAKTPVADSKCSWAKPSATTTAGCCTGPIEKYYGGLVLSTYDDLRFGPDSVCAKLSKGLYTSSVKYTTGKITYTPGNPWKCSPAYVDAYHNDLYNTIQIETGPGYHAGSSGPYQATISESWDSFCQVGANTRRGNEGGWIASDEYISSITCTDNKTTCN